MTAYAKGRAGFSKILDFSHSGFESQRGYQRRQQQIIYSSIGIYSVLHENNNHQGTDSNNFLANRKRIESCLVKQKRPIQQNRDRRYNKKGEYHIYQ